MNVAGMNRSGQVGTDVLAADGGIVRLRPVTAGDATELSALYGRGSPDSLRMRFFDTPGEHLAASARRHGVTELVGDGLAGNTGMLRVARDLDGRPSMQSDYGVIEVGLVTGIDETSLAQVDARDRVAETASLRPLFAPRAVAVVGAGREAGGIGHATLEALVEFGFTRSLYAVNPHTTTIPRCPSFRPWRRYRSRSISRSSPFQRPRSRMYWPTPEPPACAPR
jgi:hypothetical protein